MLAQGGFSLFQHRSAQCAERVLDARRFRVDFLQTGDRCMNQVSSNSSSGVQSYPLPLDQQLVLISGASRGLGAAIAHAFAREGARVVINYFQSQTAAEQLAEGLGERALAIQADVRQADQVRAMVDQAMAWAGQPVSTVISNALIDYRFDPATRADATAVTWAHYLRQLEGNIAASLNLMQATHAGMLAAGGGALIAIGSNLVDSPVVPYHDYTTAKAALLGWVRNMAAELGPDGIRVNLVAGGLIDRTDASSATSDAVFELVRASTPLRQVTSPEAMADAVVMLASPWARAITGQSVGVDGGLVMR
jgi:3-oxoacyl-[acyl-carrier protein] reductase